MRDEKDVHENIGNCPEAGPDERVRVTYFEPVSKELLRSRTELLREALPGQAFVVVYDGQELGGFVPHEE